MSTNLKVNPKFKIDLLIARLRRPAGASLDDLARITGWQAHSVRGAMARALRRKGHSVTSDKVDGVRRYWLLEPTND